VNHRDAYCYQRDHFYAERVLNNGVVQVVKVRVRDSQGEKLSLKLYLDKGFSEVWAGSSRSPRVVVPLIVEVDLADEAAIRRTVLFWLRREPLLRRVRWRHHIGR
jgi:hypothetical protein